MTIFVLQLNLLFVVEQIFCMFLKVNISCLKPTKAETLSPKLIIIISLPAQ